MSRFLKGKIGGGGGLRLIDGWMGGWMVLDVAVLYLGLSFIFGRHFLRDGSGKAKGS